MEDKTATEGDAEAVFEAELSKNIMPSDEIRWTFNGRRIDVDDVKKFSLEKIKNKCLLHIKNVELEDEGSYGIEVNDSKSSANLIISGI